MLHVRIIACLNGARTSTYILHVFICTDAIQNVYWVNFISFKILNTEVIVCANITEIFQVKKHEIK